MEIWTGPLNFNSDADGEDVLIVFGTAALDPSAPAMIDNPSYRRRTRRASAGSG